MFKIRGVTIEIDTLEKQQTEKIETEMKDVDRIRIRKVYASCPGWPSGGSKEFSSQTQIYAIPCRLQLPTNKWRSAGPGRSLYLLSITSLAALGGQYHSLSGTEYSASKRVTCLLPATQAGSHAGSKVYIWNVFGSDIRTEYCMREETRKLNKCRRFANNSVIYVR